MTCTPSEPCFTKWSPVANPFEARLFTALLDGILNVQPPAPPIAPAAGDFPKMEEIVIRRLDKQPALRYPSARELAIDLHRAAESGGQARKSIAVLYLENIGGNKEDEYFRDGVTEDIITELSKIPEPRSFRGRRCWPTATSR